MCLVTTSPTRLLVEWPPWNIMPVSVHRFTAHAKIPVSIR